MSPRPSKTPLAVGFVSLGCSKNLVDAQIMAGQLLKDGLRLVEPDLADLIVINTCAFIEAAREETRDTIRSFCERKRAGKCRAVFLAGCYAQRYHESLLREFPDADGHLGLDALDRIGTLVREWQQGASFVRDVPVTAKRLFEPVWPGLRFASGPYAWLKIAEGCSHRCSFCAIPLIRGPYRSRSISSIVQEAECLISSGARELNLISQDSMAYGNDLANQSRNATRLPELLNALTNISGEFWIRILYGSVHGVSDAVLETMRASSKICPYLDLPIQHAHPEILRAMGRTASARDLPGTIARLRAALPGLVLRTTCLVGFPGESEEHFRFLLRFVEETAFDHLGVFVFSPEEGTPAFARRDRVCPLLAEERRRQILAAQKKIVARKAKSLRNQTDTLLLERRARNAHGIGIGRTRRQAPEVDGSVLAQDLPTHSQPGDFLRIRYAGQSGSDLLAVCEPHS